MSLATLEQLKASFEDKSDANLRNTVRYFIGKDTWDDKAVQRKLDQEKQKLLAHELGKGVRPWDLVNLSKQLDPDQPWVGIEFETGYANKDNYQRIINYIWNNFPLSAVDHEGCGRYPCEITFAPVNFDSFIANDGDMDRLLKYMRLTKTPKSAHTGMVGTHCNISTPAYRKLAKTRGHANGSYGVQNILNRIVYLLNQSVGALSSDDKRVFFGRIPYGGFFVRGNKYGDWIEGKLFDSTGDLTKWRQYKEVIARMCEVLEQVSLLALDNKLGLPYSKDGKPTFTNDGGYWYDGKVIKELTITNLSEILHGTVPAAKMQFDYRDMKRVR